MKTNNNLMVKRLKETVNQKSGCSVIYLKVLKSDLNKLLKEYMKFSDIDFDIAESSDGYNLNIAVKVKEFFNIGRGE